MAGDYAFFERIGFSKDGRYFAFEEFGEQDGSGFSYANIYVIDLMTDRWAPNTPIRIAPKDELTTMAEARAFARQKAEDLDVLHDFGTNPGHLLYARGMNEAYSAGSTARISIPGSMHPKNTRESFELVLTSFPFEDTDGSGCPHGFELTRITADGRPTVIHKDKKPVKSRGCTFDYQLVRFFYPGLYKPDGAADFGVAVISYTRYGFEGADRRFIALPVPFN